jgi:hypothetical protein
MKALELAVLFPVGLPANKRSGEVGASPLVYETQVVRSIPQRRGKNRIALSAS